jgi:hypothetical protein
MTLLLTEIHGPDVFGEPAIIFAADRRISAGKLAARDQQKIIESTTSGT